MFFSILPTAAGFIQLQITGGPAKNDKIEIDRAWLWALGVDEILRQAAQKKSHEESWNQMGPYGLWGTWRKAMVDEV